MKPGTIMVCAALLAGCGGKEAAPSCESVAKQLVALDAGDKARFMTEKERTTRARRWLAKCEPMSEAERRCVLASKTMEQADACTKNDNVIPPSAGLDGKAAWLVRGGDSLDQTAQFVAFAADGDVVVAGDFQGTLDLGGQAVTARSSDAWVARLSPGGAVRWMKGFGGTARDYATGLRLADDGSFVVTVSASAPPHLSRVTLAADGTVEQTRIVVGHIVHSTTPHVNGDIVVGSRVVEPGKGGTCVGKGFVLQRFTPDGKRLWSRCDDGAQDVAHASEPMILAAGPDGMTAACAGFHSPLSWGGKTAPGSPDDHRSFVLSLTADGEQRWVHYITSGRRPVCDGLAVTDDGSVVALVRGTSPGSAVTVWEPDGTQRWTRSCSDFLGGVDCELSAVTASASNIVVAGKLGAQTVFVMLDSKTGVNRETRKFAGVARITGLAARANELVFATGFSGSADFGTGLVESAAGADGRSVDVLIGRLK